jgi:hypothetical protein
MLEQSNFVAGRQHESNAEAMALAGWDWPHAGTEQAVFIALRPVRMVRGRIDEKRSLFPVDKKTLPARLAGQDFAAPDCFRRAVPFP